MTRQSPAPRQWLFDDFYAVFRPLCPFFIISGNKTPERIAFGARLLEGSGVHLSPVYNGEIQPVVLHDEFGG